MVIAMFAILKDNKDEEYNKDNFMQDFPEHQLPGGKYVLEMDQALSDLNALADVSLGFNPESVDKAVEIEQLRLKAIKSGFPKEHYNFLTERAEEARGYLSSEEKKAFRRAIKLKESTGNTSEEHAVLEYSIR